MNEHFETARNDQVRRPSAAPHQPLSAETVELIAAILRAIGDPTRIRLIEALAERRSATVSALAAQLRMSQQNVSKQLALLHGAGVLTRRREGVWVHYELCDWTGWWIVGQLAAALDGAASEHRCPAERRPRALSRPRRAKRRKPKSRLAR